LRAHRGDRNEQDRPAYAKGYGAAGNSPENPHSYLNPRSIKKSQSEGGSTAPPGDAN
jgi:hypothetical protein